MSYFDLIQTCGSWEEILEKSNVLTTLKAETITRDVLYMAFHAVEKAGFRCGSVFMNEKSCGKQESWMTAHKVEDPTLNNYGLVAYLWGAQILINDKIPDDVLLVVGDKASMKDAPEFPQMVVISLEKEG